MSNLEQKAFESANKAFGLIEDMTWDMDKEFHNYHQEAFKEGYTLCQKEYEEKLRWIPVEEKLPETYSIILATIKSPECIWVEEIGFGEGKFQLPGRGDTSFVTHWMYVPEPPSFL